MRFAFWRSIIVVAFLRPLERYWRLLAQYLHPHRLHMALLTGILGAAISVQVALPLLTSRFINEAVAGSAMGGLVLLALLTMLLALIGQGLAVTETWVAERVSWSATNALRLDLVAHLLRLDPAFHTAHTPGELIERVDGDVGTLARFFSRFVVNVVGNGVLLIAVIGLLFAVDWRVGVGLTAFVVIGLAAMLRIRASSTHHWNAERQGSAEFYGFLGEYLAGLEDIRSSGAGAFVLRRCAKAMRTWLSAVRKAQMRGYALVATSEGLFGIGIAFALAICAVLYRDGALALGTVYLVFRYTEMLRAPTEQIRTEIQEFQQADASIGRVEALLAETPKIADGAGTSLPPGSLDIEFDGVTFGYERHHPALCDVSLRVPAGRVLGIAGHTGSGKTTLTRLVPRFHDAQQGAIRLGGVDLRDASLKELRSRVGVVAQDVHLFHASVRDNVTLFDDAVPDGRVVSVLEDVGLDAWLRELSDGVHTVIDGSAGVSAGQAQVIACARILLEDPDVVILDEASSRVDPVSERRLHRALGALLEGRTGIIVAHRLDTLAYADDLLVLEQGRVVEHGPWMELVGDTSSRFAQLLRAAGNEVLR